MSFGVIYLDNMHELRFICILIFYILIFHLGFEVKSQSHPKADSLFSALEINPTDSNAFIEIDNVVNTLFYEDADLAMSIAQKELEYAKGFKNNLAMGNAFLNIGIIYDLQGKLRFCPCKLRQSPKVATKSNL